MSLHHEEWGSGPPLVLLHGYPLNHRIWHQQKKMRNQVRVLTPDLPGFGSSASDSIQTMDDYARIVIQWLDTMGIQKVVVAGHSMGGYITLAMIANHSDRLLGAGLVCSQAAADTEEARTGRMQTIARVQKEGTSFLAGAMLPKLFSPENVKNRHPSLDNVRAIMSSVGTGGVVSALRAMASRPDRLDVLKNTKAPILIIAGADDAIVPVEKSRIMKEACPGCMYHEIDGAGHMAMMERPERVNAALADFMATL